MLLDKKLPKIDGHEVLEAIRKNHLTAVLPVVMLTSSRHELDLVKSYELGVNAYVVKPIEFGDFMDAIQDIGMFRAVLNESSVGATRPPGTPLEVISIDSESQKVTVKKRDGDGPPVPQ